MTDKTVGEALSETYKHLAVNMKNPFYGISPKVFSLPAFSMSPQGFEESSSIAGEVFELFMGAHYFKYKVKESEESYKYGLIDLFIFPVLDMFLTFTDKYCFNNGDLTVAKGVTIMFSLPLLLLNVLTRGLLSVALTLPFLPVLTLIHGQKLLAEIGKDDTKDGFVDFLGKIFYCFTGIYVNCELSINSETGVADYISLLDPLLLFVPNVVNWLDNKVPYVVKPLLALCSAVKYVLGAVLMLLFMPYVAVSYFALKDQIGSPFGAFFPGKYQTIEEDGELTGCCSRTRSFSSTYGDYGAKSFFDFFAGSRITDWGRGGVQHCGLLDVVLVVPFMIDYVYQYFKNAARGEKGVATFMAKVGLCVTTPLYVVNMAVRYALAAVLTAAVMVMKAAVLPVYGAAVALPYGASRSFAFFKNDDFEKGVESGFSTLTQVC